MIKIDNFISEVEQLEIINFLNNVKVENDISNVHIKEISSKLNGYAVMCNLTDSDISKYVAEFQSDFNTIKNLPDIFHILKDRIADVLKISKDNVFLQIIKMQKGGEVKPHYDATFPNYVTYKCNICVKGKSEYRIYIDKDSLTINETDLYAFEANFKKHWVNAYNEERILLSYGFVVPCEELGYSKEDAIVRFANRLWKYYQK